MNIPMQLICVVFFIAALSLYKLLWHGVRRKDRRVVAWHFVLVWILVLISAQKWAGVSGAVCSISLWISFVMLDRQPRWEFAWIKRRWLFGQDVFHLFSMLSTLPIQVTAVMAALYRIATWAIASSLSVITVSTVLAFAFLLFFGEGILIKFWLWQLPSLRPRHWK